MSQSPYVLLAVLLLAACQSGGGGTGVPSDADEHEPFSQIALDEVLHFTGTEPFWGGEAKGGTLTYETPDNASGATIAVDRFAGRGGISMAGKLDGQAFDMMVTPGNCSDGMSDRTYPYVVTLKIGSNARQGCGWTDRDPFDGPQHP